jgi:acetyltransferase-like isoleucine patch superfamily enzyme
MKKCIKCNTEKETTEFYKNKNTKDGLAYKCKTCKKQYNNRNKVKINERARLWHRNNKDKVAERLKRYKAKIKPCCYIYKHKNFFYVGSTNQHTSRRFTGHKVNVTTGLGQYIKEHNLEKKDFELQTFFFDTIQEARTYEKKLICKHIENPKCLNIQRW